MDFSWLWGSVPLSPTSPLIRFSGDGEEGGARLWCQERLLKFCFPPTCNVHQLVSYGWGCSEIFRNLESYFGPLLHCTPPNLDGGGSVEKAVVREGAQLLGILKVTTHLARMTLSESGWLYLARGLARVYVYIYIIHYPHLLEFCESQNYAQKLSAKNPQILHLFGKILHWFCDIFWWFSSDNAHTNLVQTMLHMYQLVLTKNQCRY